MTDRQEREPILALAVRQLDPFREGNVVRPREPHADLHLGLVDSRST
jgi:hypothetical protein